MACLKSMITLLATQCNEMPLMYEAIPRTANKRINSIGIIAITSGSFSTNAPSSIGCISAGIAGSVAAKTIMLTIDNKKRFQ